MAETHITQVLYNSDFLIHLALILNLESNWLNSAISYKYFFELTATNILKLIYITGKL